MKRTLLFIACVLTSLTMLAQDDFAVEDIQNSGCLTQTRGEEPEALPTIVLTKEGSILSVQLLNYESNCATVDFEVDSQISGGNDDTPSVTISVTPIVPTEMTVCTCPFNISFTVRGLEENKFNLTCWWYGGQVELTEGEPLVLEYKTEDVVIDGLKFTLLKTTHQAKLLFQNTLDDKAEIMQIPSEVEYEGEKYIVTSINEGAFVSNTVIKQITIPKTIKNTNFGSMNGITSNLFAGCSSLETIEVDEENPAMCSLDGVLFNKNKTTLISYPAASPRESYYVPDDVITAARGAFFSSQHLKRIVLPDNMETLGVNLFGNSNSLEEVILPSNIKELPVYLFKDCKKLKSVNMPKGLTTIGYSAFEGCSTLEFISLPNSVVTVDFAAFMNCTSLKSVTLSPNLKELPQSMFKGCSNLSKLIIPSGITSIGNGAFVSCEAMQSFDLPESINFIDDFAFGRLPNLKDIYCHSTTVPNTNKNAFYGTDLSQATLHVPATSVSAYQAVEPWKNFKGIVALPDQDDYRPFVEEGKVWQVGAVGTGNPVQVVEYYYFDGDTIIDGKTCKQMMCQRYVNPDFPEYDTYSLRPSPWSEGSFYEENKKVYKYDLIQHEFKLWYDFSLDAYGSVYIGYYGPYVLGPMQIGCISGFKGAWRDVMTYSSYEDRYYDNSTWLESVGNIEGPAWSVYYGKEYHGTFLMACVVGDEVIYLNDEFEDGATPEEMNAPKRRFDFTHTTKEQPKTPRRSEEEQSLYGEYNDVQLGINLEPVDEAYQVRITDETGKTVYEKAVNAGNIVGLNIDISTYAKGRYTVIVENSQELFTGEFETQATGIEEVRCKTEDVRDAIYNLQGQRLSTLQKGLNIVNGQKVFVK